MILSTTSLPNGWNSSTRKSFTEGFFVLRTRKFHKLLLMTEWTSDLNFGVPVFPSLATKSKGYMHPCRGRFFFRQPRFFLRVFQRIYINFVNSPQCPPKYPSIFSRLLISSQGCIEFWALLLKENPKSGLFWDTGIFDFLLGLLSQLERPFN